MTNNKELNHLVGNISIQDTHGNFLLPNKSHHPHIKNIHAHNYRYYITNTILILHTSSCIDKMLNGTKTALAEQMPSNKNYIDKLLLEC